MKNTIHDFEKTIKSVDSAFARRMELKILQVNMGNMCNQRCVHCHINASPKGDKIMPRRIADDVIRFLSKSNSLSMDVTGGCPELNPNFRYLMEGAKPFVKKIISRSNLTIFFEKGMEGLPEFYRKNKIKLICSMPCYTKENVDNQRGKGVYDKSIEALEILNRLGYGKEKELELDLAYNPGGAFLPENQENLEQDYKRILYEEHGILFNRLLTITNAPINRFEQYLKVNGEYDKYMRLLTDKFNKDIAGGIMCRTLLSVGWDGIIYDCDFNQALGLAARDNNGSIMEIGKLEPQDLKDKEIIFENHCYCCTAGSGSSCAGVLERAI